MSTRNSHSSYAGPSPGVIFYLKFTVVQQKFILELYLNQCNFCVWLKISKTLRQNYSPTSEMQLKLTSVRGNIELVQILLHTLCLPHYSIILNECGIFILWNLCLWKLYFNPKVVLTRLSICVSLAADYSCDKEVIMGQQNARYL